MDVAKLISVGLTHSRGIRAILEGEPIDHQGSKPS
jgi:hypothetical protein